MTSTTCSACRRRAKRITSCFGHAGDGNLHARLVKRPEAPLKGWPRKIDRALTELYRETKALGGMLSGEHGVGAKRKKYIGIFLSKDEIDLMRRIKRAFDPNGIMNPGKIFDA